MSRGRILVVEEDDALANMYRLALSIAGFDVEVAGDGLTALEDIDEGHPDLVVLDLNIPQLAGEAVLSEVAATPDTRDIPVVVISGKEMPVELAPASVVLRKPCDPGDLVAVVSRYLH